MKKLLIILAVCLVVGATAARAFLTNMALVMTVSGKVTPPPPPMTNLLTSDRDASANWAKAGLISVGGIPSSSYAQCGTTLTPGPSGTNDVTAINNAITACGANQYVSLGAGTFNIAEGSTIIINKNNVVVRGQGAGVTTVQHPPGQDTTNNVCNAPGPWGATIGSFCPGNNPKPVVRLGGGYGGIAATFNLSADAANGATSVTTSSTPTGVVAGSLINVDELGNGVAQPSPDWVNASGVAQGVWAGGVVPYLPMWNAHNPTISFFDSAVCLYNTNNFNCGSSDPTAYSIRAGGILEEYHLVTGVSGNTITFDSPLTLPYHTANTAAVELFNNIVQYAGLENLTVAYGDNDNVDFQGCLYCWAYQVENTKYLNPGFHLVQGSFRNQLENVWVHEGAWPVNGGGGYNIALTYGSSEDYIANSISMKANKVIAMRASGAGTVVAYNYMDDGYINGSSTSTWVETGLNCSHLGGSHHALFEGNQAFNADSDYTHGASPYCTYFRNYLTGIRATFTGLDGIVRNDAAGCCSPMRAASSHPYTYWTSFIGNILGTAGVTTPGNGWDYQNNAFTNRHLLMLGWNDCTVNQSGTTCGPDNTANVIYPNDPRVLGTTGRFASSNGCMAGSNPCTTIVTGNFDYVQNQTSWDVRGPQTLPNSFYTNTAPPFFSGSIWPPYNPVGPVINDIPAHARWVACGPTPTAACLFPGAPPPQSVTSIALSNNTTTIGLSSGTSVGTLSASLSPVTPTFTYSGTNLHLSTTGADSGGVCTTTNGSGNGSFQVLSGDQLATNGTLTVGTKNVCVAASATGVTAKGQAFTITVGNQVDAVAAPGGGCTGSGTAASPWNYKCIQNGVDAASAGDTVFLRAGYFVLNVNTDAAPVQVTKSITLVGAGSGNTFDVYGHVNNADGTDACPGTTTITCVATIGSAVSPSVGYFQFNGACNNDAVSHILFDGSRGQGGGDGFATLSFFQCSGTTNVTDIRVMGPGTITTETQFWPVLSTNVTVQNSSFINPLQGGNYGDGQVFQSGDDIGLTVKNNMFWQFPFNPINDAPLTFTGNITIVDATNSHFQFPAYGVTGCSLNPGNIGGKGCASGTQGTFGAVNTNNYFAAGTRGFAIGGGVNDPSTNGNIGDARFTGNWVFGSTAAIAACEWSIFAGQGNCGGGGMSTGAVANGTSPNQCNSLISNGHTFGITNNSIIGSSVAVLEARGQGTMLCYDTADPSGIAVSLKVFGFDAEKNYLSSPSNQYVTNANTISPTQTGNFCSSGAGTVTGCATSGFTTPPTCSFMAGTMSGSIVPITATNFTAQYGAVQWLTSTTATTPLSSDTRWTSNNSAAPNTYVPPVQLSGVSHGNTVYMWVMDSANHIAACGSVLVP